MSSKKIQVGTMSLATTSFKSVDRFLYPIVSFSMLIGHSLKMDRQNSSTLGLDEEYAPV